MWRFNDEGPPPNPLPSVPPLELELTDIPTELDASPPKPLPSVPPQELELTDMLTELDASLRKCVVHRDRVVKLLALEPGERKLLQMHADLTEAMSKLEHTRAAVTSGKLPATASNNASAPQLLTPAVEKAAKLRAEAAAAAERLAALKAKGPPSLCASVSTFHFGQSTPPSFQFSFSAPTATPPPSLQPSPLMSPSCHAYSLWPV